MIQSLAGGTGSGVGTYLLDCLKEEFSDLNILNCAIVPHQTGEVILQSYNCVNSISHIY
jgi:tubulin delta